MLRKFYLGTLLMLQWALLVQAGPPLWRGLRLDTVLTASRAGHVDYAPLAVTGLAVLGVVLTLSFPTVVSMRHCLRGETHFCGLPRWAVAIACAGAAILLIGCALQWLTPLSSVEWRLALGITSRNAVTAGALLTTAGVLCAELLHRNAGAASGATTEQTAAARAATSHPPRLPVHATARIPVNGGKSP